MVDIDKTVIARMYHGEDHLGILGDPDVAAHLIQDKKAEIFSNFAIDYCRKDTNKGTHVALESLNTF